MAKTRGSPPNGKTPSGARQEGRGGGSRIRAAPAVLGFDSFARSNSGGFGNIGGRLSGGEWRTQGGEDLTIYDNNNNNNEIEEEEEMEDEDEEDDEMCSEETAVSEAVDGKRKRSTGAMKKKVVDAGTPRPFVDHLVIDLEFLNKHSLVDVVELLTKQGWDSLFLDTCTINQDLCRQFFSTLAIEGDDDSMVAHFCIDQKKRAFTTRELAGIIGAPHEGFYKYHKGTWPRDCKKDELKMRVNGSTSTTNGTSGMNILAKIVYMYTICNLVPRKEKRGNILIQDYFLIDKIVSGYNISLPILVMKHLQHARFVPTHGIPFGWVIKKILSYYNVYNEGSERQTLILGKPLDMKCLNQASFKFVDEKWVKESKQRHKLGSERGAEEEEALTLQEPAAVIPDTHTHLEIIANMIKQHSKDMHHHLDQIEKRIDKRIERAVKKIEGKLHNNST